MPSSTAWPLDPHTLAKHVILRKYLNAWLPKITRWNGRVVFCDGFAGPGVYSGGEDGSPVIALKAFLDHSYRDRVEAEIKYLFIEENEERYNSLRKVVGAIEVPDSIGITIMNDTYAEAFAELLDYLDEQDSKLAPTFAFIDPFGVKGLPLSIISRLMAHRGCEVLITFMVGSLNRFISTPEFESHCDALFGSDSWRDALQLTGADRESFFRALYQRRLSDRDGANAEYVRHFTMKNERNVTIYDLFFATNHKSGIDAMKDAMWHVDSSGGYSFSDATNPSQETFFSANPDWQQLIDDIVDEYGTTTVRWTDVAESIRRSPFRILKRPIKDFAKGDEPRIEILNPEGTRRDTINERTRIRFLG